MELPPMPERQGFDEDTKLRAPTLTKTREIIILYSISASGLSFHLRFEKTWGFTGLLKLKPVK